jgi:sugar/nucleoside kinase (ribokinase family)
MKQDDLRRQCAETLGAAAARAPGLRALVGLDGFVDQIIHVVDKRDEPSSFKRLSTITGLAERIAAAAGRSTNIELVAQRTKLGGNGPIMANALVDLGLAVTYVGALGHPAVHPVFQEFTRRAEVYSIAEAGHTDALEFDDGKLMLGKSSQLSDVTWARIQERVGRQRFIERFLAADLVGFVNWTMLPYMSEIWAALLDEVCPGMQARRTIFFDLADPEKRTAGDIRRAIELIARFERHFDVILGLNEKEAHEVGKALGLDTTRPGRDGLAALALDLSARIPVGQLLVHPTAWALAVSRGPTSADVAMVDGPFTERPLITTGAGDHFNAGFCVGRLLGLDAASALLAGVTCSGHYVRTGQSPRITDLRQILVSWPRQ